MDYYCYSSTLKSIGNLNYFWSMYSCLYAHSFAAITACTGCSAFCPSLLSNIKSPIFPSNCTICAIICAAGNLPDSCLNNFVHGLIHSVYMKFMEFLPMEIYECYVATCILSTQHRSKCRYLSYSKNDLVAGRLFCCTYIAMRPFYLLSPFC